MQNLINEEIRAQQAKSFKSYQDGQDLIEILSQIYVDTLPGKTSAQGKIMGEQVIKDVESFSSDFKAACENLDEFIYSRLDALTSGKTPAEKCTYLRRLSATVALFKDDVNIEEVSRQIEAITISEDEATPDNENAFREEAAATLKNTPSMLNVFVKHAEELSENSADTTKLMLTFGKDEIAARAIFAMLAYTSIVKNGGINGTIPSISQVTTSICAELEEMKIAEAVNSGSLAVEVGAMLLTILGVVVWMRLFIDISVITSFVIMNTFPLIIALPALFLFFVSMINVSAEMFEKFYEGNRIVSEFTISTVKAVYDGLKRVGLYILEYFIPSLREKSAQTEITTNNELAFA